MEKTPARVAMIVDEPLAVIGHQPGKRDQRQPGGEFLLDAPQALGMEGFHRQGLLDGLVEFLDRPALMI